MNTDVGQRLKDLRKKLRLTQKGLAQQVPGGINYTYIGKIERREQKPSLKILEKISQALGVPIGYFFEEDTPVDLTGLLPKDLQKLARDPKRREFFQVVTQLKDEDVPLVTEIIDTLNRYHKARETGQSTPLKRGRGRPRIEPFSQGHSFAAEKKQGYRGKK